MSDEIVTAKQEMNANITALTDDYKLVDSLKNNAMDVSKLAHEYRGFKNKL